MTESNTPEQVPAERGASAQVALRRRVDYRGALRTYLKDLTGFETLAFELLQNADDAPATMIRFDIRDSHFIVDNDGAFSDCGEPSAETCSLREKRGHQCDFHRFLALSSGGKRAEEGTTGAFGIGFTAVYQVTDRPELISGERHWVLSDRGDGSEIDVCPGCEVCKSAELPGTRFILPWARDPASLARQDLEAAAITAEGISDLEEVLIGSLPTALLFLRHLTRATVRRMDGREETIERLSRSENSVRVRHNGLEEHWLTAGARFGDQAADLRRLAPTSFSPKRQDTVTIAVRSAEFTGEQAGRLCAYLPTEERTVLPCHINADFVVTSDRKRLVASGTNAQWNRAALRAAAAALRAALPIWLDYLPESTIWSILEGAYSHRSEDAWKALWADLKPVAADLPLARSTDGARVSAGMLLMGVPTDATQKKAVESIGLRFVDPQLSRYRNLLFELGAKDLSVERIVEALDRSGLRKALVPMELAPEVVARPELRHALLAAIAGLGRTAQPLRNAGVPDRAVLLGSDGALHAPGSLFLSSDPETIALFGQTMAGCFVSIDDVAKVPAPLAGFCKAFGPAQALDLVAGTANLSNDDARRILRWFAVQERSHASEWGGRLRSLRVFPTSRGLEPLQGLSVPGDFSDPLGISRIIDVQGDVLVADLVKFLGAPTLSFGHYVAGQLAPLLQGEKLEDTERKRCLAWLLDVFDGVVAVPEARGALAAGRIVECEDGSFRCGAEVHFGNDLNRDVLGPSGVFALCPDEAKKGRPALYKWLGVRETPSFAAILGRIEWLSRCKVSADSVKSTERVWRHLGKETERAEELPEELADLTRLAWLPSEGDFSRWYRPAELMAAFSKHLCERSKRFLAFDLAVQKSSNRLMGLLGLATAPTGPDVVEHLRRSVEVRIPVNVDVYRVLDEKTDWDPKRLAGVECLQGVRHGDTVEFFRPTEAFAEHPFGQRRWKIGADLRKHGEFLRRVGYRERPGVSDALSIIGEISKDYGGNNVPVKGEDRAILDACWRLLNEAMDSVESLDETLAKELKGKKCIANGSGVLLVPRHAFFDDRPDLSVHFGAFLSSNLVKRHAEFVRAQRAAGVRPVSAVITTCAQVERPEDAPDLQQLLLERRNEIIRVLSSTQDDDKLDVRGLQERLIQVLPRVCESLVVELRCQVETREKTVRLCQESACWDANSEVLYFVRSGGGVPWPAFARELAFAVEAGRDPGRHGFGLAAVLQAATASDAAATLSAFGVRELALDESPAVESAEVSAYSAEGAAPSEWETSEPGGGRELDTLEGLTGVGRGLGESGDLGEMEGAGYTHGRASGSRAGMGERGGGSSGDDAGRPGERGESTGARAAATSDSEYGDRLDGSRQAGGNSGPWREGSGDGSTPGGSRAGQAGGEEKPAGVPGRDPGGRYRSYVIRSGSAVGLESAASTDENRAVQQAAERLVVEFEERCGRAPKQMPPNNPGFDIVSDGRLIEVKGLRGRWTSWGVVVTAMEFETGRQEAFGYWLYVVEEALSENAKIYCIQNPMCKVDQFLFDERWKDASEAGTATLVGVSGNETAESEADEPPLKAGIVDAGEELPARGSE